VIRTLAHDLRRSGSFVGGSDILTNPVMMRAVLQEDVAFRAGELTRAG
jgi:hypothetical protein